MGQETGLPGHHQAGFVGATLRWSRPCRTLVSALASLLVLATVLGSAPGARAATERSGGSKQDPPAAWNDAHPANLAHIGEVIGADGLHRAGTTGQGVGVALIDSGVAPVGDLGQITFGPDLSLESQDRARLHVDSYGHGTHMAGIIAGSSGIAPGAHLISLKVAAADGATDVSQVIAAIDWVVQHRNDPGLNIRVLNLSFGTDGRQDYRLDPLAFAVEAAWRHGIVVVVAGGNGGEGTPLNNPATAPFVLAVGAADTRGTPQVTDDGLAGFSSSGDATRTPDLVAPGASVVSTRAPGSYLDLAYPQARLGDRGFKGSGTSQSAAVVSGAAALLLSQHPHLTPDQVKALLMATARELPSSGEGAHGEGMLDVGAAARRTVMPPLQTWEPATGLGSLEAARGTSHITTDGVELAGERDLFGPWDAAAWALRAATGRSWDEDPTGGRTWSGRSWSGRSWSGRSWSGRSWSGRSWSGRSWSGSDWGVDARTAGLTWTARSWGG